MAEVELNIIGQRLDSSVCSAVTEKNELGSLMYNTQKNQFQVN